MNGVEVVFDEVNAAGGVHGRKLQLSGKTIVAMPPLPSAPSRSWFTRIRLPLAVAEHAYSL
jgi:hypothetical protein